MEKIKMAKIILGFILMVLALLAVGTIKYLHDENNQLHVAVGKLEEEKAQLADAARKNAQEAERLERANNDLIAVDKVREQAAKDSAEKWAQLNKKLAEVLSRDKDTRDWFTAPLPAGVERLCEEIGGVRPGGPDPANTAPGTVPTGNPNAASGKGGG